MENGILVERKYLSDLELSALKQKKGKKSFVPHNITEYFFYDEFGYLNMDDRKVLECYSEFTSVLMDVFQNLKQIYIKFTQKAISEEDLKFIDFPRVPKDLEMNGLEHYLINFQNFNQSSPQKKVVKAKMIQQQDNEVEEEK
mmetsp:Transcript_7619/g.6982  ORF Transcript_7619/g.6982 Transcript_7619/m.6982 type:complete len:142 (+) Transcript_7619:592-1017(+)